MIYFPETIDTISTISPTYLHTFFLGYARELTLCMLAFWSHEGVVFLDFLPSPHFVTSFLLPCLGSTDALCPRLGDPVPLPPKWRPYSQGPRTHPYQDPEQLCLYVRFCEWPSQKWVNEWHFSAWMIDWLIEWLIIDQGGKGISGVCGLVWFYYLCVSE